MRRFIATVLVAAFTLGAAPSYAGSKPYALPSYIVTVRLSQKADQKLSEAKELVHVSAHYFGIPLESKEADKSGEFALGDEEADLQGSSAALLGKFTFKARDLSKIVGGSPKVHVTVTSARKVLSGDVLKCTEFKDYIPASAQPRIAITCKLTDE